VPPPLHQGEGVAEPGSRAVAGAVVVVVVAAAAVVLVLELVMAAGLEDAGRQLGVHFSPSKNWRNPGRDLSGYQPARPRPHRATGAHPAPGGVSGKLPNADSCGWLTG
jgi:hypothetical protein